MFREAGRSTPMMAADRSTLSCRALLFLFVSFGLPSWPRSATLEDSAKELAHKIAAALPPGKCVLRNPKSFILATRRSRPNRTGAQGGIAGPWHPLAEQWRAITVVVTLSENFKNLVWTAEIHKGDASQVVLIDADHPSENRAVSKAMPVTIRSEKFWEGPERILDAGEISDGAGKSWLVFLLPDGLRIQDKQTGSASTTEITSMQSASRDPWGNLKFDPVGNTIAFFLSPRVCTVNLETPDLSGCPPAEGTAGGPLPGRFPMMFDLSPPGPPPPGKGTVIEMKPYLRWRESVSATGARDYTQPDSLQVFQMESSGAVAVSAELDFPGPITALHAVSDAPRAVVRNLATGNYEAYRLSFSCGQ